MTDTFANIKVGDKVTILDRNDWRPIKVRTVEKVLKNWFVVGGDKYGFNGWEKTSGQWAREYKCKYWEQADTDQIRTANKRYKLKQEFKEKVDLFTEEDIDWIQSRLDDIDIEAYNGKR